MNIEAYRRIQAEAHEDSARLVAVSKTRSIEEIKALYDEGHRIFGENRLSEITKKKVDLPDDIEWHLIGPLQSKKVKHFDKDITLFHALDREKIWHKLSDWANEEGIVVDALIQIHIAQESTKHGFYVNELLDLLRTGAHLEWSGVRIRGLMGMATFTNDESIIESEFASLRSSFEQLKNEFYKNKYFTELSIGMSSDYKIALKNGASLIRVGTNIFGPRNYAT